MEKNPSSLDFAKVWNLLAIAYPNFCKEQGPDLLAQTMKLYQQLLADLPAEHLKAAALRHIQSSRFFPTVAELRESAVVLVQAPRQSAMEAWGEVMDAMADARYYVFQDHCRVPEFDNPITNRLIRSMGWRELSRSENAIADRARFIDAYNQLVAREQNEAPLSESLRAGAARPALGDGNGNGTARLGAGE